MVGCYGLFGWSKIKMPCILEDDVLKLLLWPFKIIGKLLPILLMIVGVLAVISLAVGMLYR